MQKKKKSTKYIHCNIAGGFAQTSCITLKVMNFNEVRVTATALYSQVCMYVRPSLWPPV